MLLYHILLTITFSYSYWLVHSSRLVLKLFILYKGFNDGLPRMGYSVCLLILILRSHSVKVTGTIVHSDLEGGNWILVTHQGVTYQLEGGDNKLYLDGQKVEIEGSIAQNRMGIAMVGDILEVKRYRILS